MSVLGVSCLNQATPYIIDLFPSPVYMNWSVYEIQYDVMIINNGIELVSLY